MSQTTSPNPTNEIPMPDTKAFWPNGARLAVSLSLMFEGGGQPISGAGGVIPDPIEKGVPDLPTNAFAFCDTFQCSEFADHRLARRGGRYSGYRSRDSKSRLSRINAARRLRSSIASKVKPPCRYFPLRFPFGAPLPAAPPCIRQRVLPATAGDWHGVPRRVRARQRGARRKREGSRVFRRMGLSSVFVIIPPPSSLAHRANDRLSAGVDVHVLDGNFLLPHRRSTRNGSRRSLSTRPTAPSKSMRASGKFRSRLSDHPLAGGQRCAWPASFTAIIRRIAF